MSYVISEQVKNPNDITDEAAHIFLEGEWKYFILAPLEELGDHVLSFWVRGKTAGDMIINYADKQMHVSVTTDWQKVIFRFTAETITNIWIYFSGEEYWMYNTQLEVGDFATDYSRNPQDVQGDIDKEIAGVKEQIEQYRKEASADILVTQESITQSVTALEERISRDYYTKTESSSIIVQTQNSILQTVSSNITETLKDYSTTTQMNSAIEQKESSITSTVSQQIKETRTYAETLANNAKKESVEETTITLQSQITQTQNNILQTVSATYATNGTVNQVKSSVASVEITANKINWLVKSGTSSSNFELTDRAATLVANYINLKGLVQFSGLDSSTRSTITKVSNWSSSSNTTLIDGGKIYTGSITADKIKINELSALNATIGGWSITTSAIYRNSSTYDSSGGMYFGSSGLSINGRFSVSNSGVLRSKYGDDIAELSNGALNFYRSGTLVASYKPAIWSGTGTIGATIVSGSNGSFISFAKSSGSSSTTNVLINNGLNPGGYTENLIVYGSIRVTSNVTINHTIISGMTWPTSGYIYYGIKFNGSGIQTTGYLNHMTGKLTVGYDSVQTDYYLTVGGTSYFSGNMTLFSLNGCSISKTTWDSSTSFFTVSGSGIYTSGVYNIMTGGLTVGATNRATGTSLYVYGLGIINGHVGIGAFTYSSIYTLYIAGSFLATGNGYVNTSISVTSDERLKKDIEPLEYEKSLDFISRLKGISFRYKDNEFGRKHHGFGAAQVKECMGDDDWGVYVDTEYSKTEDDDIESFRALRYEEIIADLVNVVQGLHKEIETLKQNIL